MDRYYALDYEYRKYLSEILNGKYISGSTAYIIRDTTEKDLFSSSESVDWWLKEIGSEFKLAFIVKPKKK